MMNRRRRLFSAILSTALILMPLAAFPGDQPLSLKHGLYMRGRLCKGAPNAEILVWDGIGLSGAHSSQCTSQAQHQSGTRFQIKTTCLKLGDGTPYRQLPLVQRRIYSATAPARKVDRNLREVRMMSPEQTAHKRVPASFFGMPLGLVALGLAWRSAASIWPVPKLIAEILIWSGSALWAVLFIVYLGKWLLRRTDAQEELQHPIQCCFIGLAGVVGLLVSIGLSTEFPTLAVATLCLGFVWTLVFAVYRTGRLWMGERSPESTTAVLYLPTVAGMLVAASAATALGYRDWGQLAFGAGMFSWLAIESVLLHRLYTASALAPALRPTLGIQMAPPAVAAVAYLNISAGGVDLFAHALIGYAILQALIVIRLFPWLRAAGLTPAWWSFSFAAAALPTAAMKMIAKGDDGAVAILAPYLFAAGNLMIAAIVVATIILVARGRLFPTI
jgi:tellurite resistance protein